MRIQHHPRLSFKKKKQKRRRAIMYLPIKILYIIKKRRILQLHQGPLLIILASIFPINQNVAYIQKRKSFIFATRE